MQKADIVLPQTTYFTSRLTKMAAKAYIDGVAMVFEANGQQPPPLKIKEEKDRDIDGNRILYQVVLED